MIGLDMALVLDGDTKTEIGSDAVLHQCLDQLVRKGEVIGCGIVLIGVKIAEDVGNIHISVAAERTADIVQSGVRDACVRKVLHRGKVQAVKA